MKITEDIKIDWHHNVENKTTSCVLTVIIQDGVLSYPKEFVAVAKCGHGDQFSKQSGRKLSLTRVLKTANLTKEARAFIWTALRERSVKL